MLINITGALGLFLLGMWLMTEGLKLAGGPALKHLLGRWTSSRLRGLGAGALITALVQSSGAVTMAAIGFVNTQLMSFQQALWVVFGSNVGTTFTAWIVTLLGFSFSIDNLTYPLIGLGAALRIFAPYERGRSLGMALAGFGLLFMGIDALKVTFAGVAESVDLSQMLGHTSALQLVLAVFVGLVLTVLTQSSSASIAILLTAVSTNVVDLELAAAGVIGANIGSTSTALLATAGATANAKRLAVAHIVFNLITASVALLILPLFLGLLNLLLEDATGADNPTVLIALFHTSFNILGVLLMWPLEPHLSRHLNRLFVTRRKRFGVHIDANIATIPDLAIRAAGLELKALIDTVSRLSFSTEPQSGPPHPDFHSLPTHLAEVDEFLQQTLKSGLTEQQSNQIGTCFAVIHYLQYACQTFSQASQLLSDLNVTAPRVLLNRWLETLNQISHELTHEDPQLRQEELQRLNSVYRQLKQDVISSAVTERTTIALVDDILQAASLSRRYLEQICQALDNYELLPDGGTPEAEPLPA